MALQSALRRLLPSSSPIPARALALQCRVARPSAVLDRPLSASAAAAVKVPKPADEAPASDEERPERRRRAPRRRAASPRHLVAAAASGDSDSDTESEQQGPAFTPVESAASLILRGLLQPASVGEGTEGEGEGSSGSSSSGDSGDRPSTVPLAVEGDQGLAVAVLALSRAQHALRTERGLELVVEAASTRRGRGPRGNTSLRARLRAAPAQPPTDRPIRRVDVVAGMTRNAVVAAAVDALRASAPAPVDLVARGPRAASNALAALGLVRATLLSGAASFTPAPPPPWVAKDGTGKDISGGGKAGSDDDEDNDNGASAAAPVAARPPPAFPPCDLSAVLDALPPARPAAVAGAQSPPSPPPPPHEMVVRLRLTTGPPPPRERRAPAAERRAPREEAGRRRERRVDDGQGAATAAGAGSKVAEKEGGAAAPRRRRSPSSTRAATRREKQSAVAELRAAAAAPSGGGGGRRRDEGEASSSSSSLRRELAELGERVRDLARMNAVVLDLLEKKEKGGG